MSVEVPVGAATEPTFMAVRCRCVRGAMLVWQDDDWGMRLEECGVGCGAGKK